MSSDRPHIQIILSSTREGRFGETVAKWFHSVAESRQDLTTELLDLRDWSMPFFDQPMSPAGGNYADEAKPWAAKIAQGDGYVIVTPEYNHGYPAVLKNAMDHLYREWNNKPVAFVSYGGGAGGARSVEQLRLVAVELQMAPIRETVVIPMARAAFNEQGEPINPALNERANAVLDQIKWWAEALKTARLS
jgi:NAD(P)H-dependent FMN reductase